MGYSFRLAARVLLYAPSQDSTYHGLCYTSWGTRNSSMGPPWRIDLTIHRTMSKRSCHRATSRSHKLLVSVYLLKLHAYCTAKELRQTCHNFSMFRICIETRYKCLLTRNKYVASPHFNRKQTNTYMCTMYMYVCVYVCMCQCKWQMFRICIEPSDKYLLTRTKFVASPHFNRKQTNTYMCTMYVCVCVCVCVCVSVHVRNIY